MLKKVTHILSYSEKKIEGFLFFSTPNEVEKVFLSVIQSHGDEIKSKIIGKCEIFCKGNTEIPYHFEIKPIFTQAHGLFPPKLKEVHELIQVEGASYCLKVQCLGNDEEEIMQMPILWAI